MIVKILQSGEPKLREVSKPVGKIDKKIKTIIKDLKNTLSIQRQPEGVGLAAPQIGKNIRIFVINYKNIKRVIINPEIVETSNKKDAGKKRRITMEGCLSLPNYYGELKRAAYIKLRYLNEEGKDVVEDFKDFYAQIVLHEIDHLEGKLFIDQLIKQGKPMYKLVGNEWEEVELT